MRLQRAITEFSGTEEPNGLGILVQPRPSKAILQCNEDFACLGSWKFQALCFIWCKFIQDGSMPQVNGVVPTE